MKIAIIASDYAPTIGGVQTAVRNIAHCAKQRGNAVTIISYQVPGSLETETVDDIVVHRLPWGRQPISSLPIRAWQTLVGMARVLRDFKPDLVYVHFLSINALWVLLLHYAMPFRLVVSARGNDIQGIPQRSRLQRWMLARLYARADAILFCSAYVQRDAAPYLVHASPRAFVGVVGDGYDPAEFVESHPYQNDTPYLLAMGRLVHKKGFDVLMRAFAQIAAEFPHMQVIIAGDGDERPALEKLMDDLDLRERVVLFGFADRPTSLALFWGCTFFVLSSRLEPFGIVVVEAMAAHKPVLATKSGGVVDLVNEGVSGMLVAPDNVDELAQAMRAMLVNPDATRAMGERAFVTNQARTWDAVTVEFLNVFERVLANP